MKFIIGQGDSTQSSALKRKLKENFLHYQTSRSGKIGIFDSPGTTDPKVIFQFPTQVMI